MQVYMETYGCSANQSDSEIMAGLLQQTGIEITKNLETADLVIVNTCIVKSPTDHKVTHRLKQVQKEYPNKKLVVAGCMPRAEYEKVREVTPKASLIGPHSVKSIGKVVRKTMEGKRVEELDGRDVKLCLPKVLSNPVIDIVQISEGCVSDCAYCIVKKARGKIRSFLPDKIVEEVKNARQSGCKEFWLTSQDTACYGYEKGITLPELLEKITTEVKGKYFLRVGMMNPRNVLPVLEPLIEAYHDPQLFKFLHLPVQSGSDKVLERMNRNYKSEDFKHIVKAFRKALPKLTLWTDVITGFPGESKEDFEETYQLIKEIEPDYVNVSKFGARPGTKAADMKPLDSKVVKRRSKKMSVLVDDLILKANQKWLGWEGEVLVDKRGFGRNPHYKLVKCKGLPGEFVNVKIKGVEKSHLY